MSQKETPEETGAQSMSAGADSTAVSDNAEADPEAAAPAGSPPGAAIAEVEEPSEGDATAPRPPARKGPYITAILALAFAFFAAAASGFLWWQYRQFYVALDQADADAAGSLQGVRANLRGLGDRVQSLETSEARFTERTADLDERLDALPGRFLDLEERLTAVQGVSEDARRSWLRAEAEYFLTVANGELSLGGRWENAISALEYADAKLRELADPALSGVRERIARELQDLRGVRLVDVEGLSYSLGRLGDRVGELPMRATVSGSFGSRDPATEESEPGLGRVWLSLKKALAGMVSIQRQEDPAARALTVNEQTLVRRQLELELEMARLGLLRGQAEVFQVSLVAAKARLEEDFQASDPAVESSVALLEDMMALDIAPAPPDISGSLNLLRSAPVREN